MRPLHSAALGAGNQWIRHRSASKNGACCKTPDAPGISDNSTESRSVQRAIGRHVRFIGKPGRALSGNPAVAGTRSRPTIWISGHYIRRHSEFLHKQMNPQYMVPRNACSCKAMGALEEGQLLGTDPARPGPTNNGRGNAKGRTKWNACRILTQSKLVNGSTRCAQFSTMKARFARPTCSRCWPRRHGAQESSSLRR